MTGLVGSGSGSGVGSGVEFGLYDVFRLDVECIVNPVNCVGVSGAGLAKAFAKRYPVIQRLYVADCERGLLVPGGVRFYRERDRWIACVATKQHWRRPSRLEWVERGLSGLREGLEVRRIGSVAIPALGAGLGGLNWNDVADAIGEAFNRSEVDVYACEPRSGV